MNDGKGKSPKLGVTITPEMESALNRHAAERGAPVSSIVREAIRDWLKARGQNVETTVTWGGDRRADDE